MKKICLILALVCILVISTALPAFAAEKEYNPLAFGTYTGHFDTTVTIPANTAFGLSFPSHSLTYDTTYSVTYDLNNGQISSARILRHDFKQGQVSWEGGRA